MIPVLYWGQDYKQFIQKVVLTVFKEMIAQLKQNPGMMQQFVQGNVVLAGVNSTQQQAMLDIFKGQETAKEQVRKFLWF